MASRGGFLVGDTSLRRRKTILKVGHSVVTKGKTTRRKKKKPEWDDTVNDLAVLKATQEELKKRREVHKSKNTGEVHSLANKENNMSSISTPDSTKRKQAILQEILYGQDKFQDVLAESDKTMSVIKDLFGDDPKKYLGFPNVTIAPQIPEEEAERFKCGPFAEPPETPTHLSVLSDSVMRTPALNELSDAEEGESSDTETSPPNVPNGVPLRFAFEPKLDLQRFQQFVTQEQLQNGHQVATNFQHQNVRRKSVPEGAPETSVNIRGTGQLHMGHAFNAGAEVQHQFSIEQSQDSVSQLSFVNRAGNDTVLASAPNFMRQVPQQSSAEPTSVAPIPTNDRVQAGAEKSLKKEKSSKNNSKGDSSLSSTASGGLKSLDDLKKMVQSLEDEIAQYEMETGRQPSNVTTQTSSFSGYTSALIMAVTKLMRYLKESETQRRAETVLREQIMQGFSEQRTLIDALTNDILQTQEQNLVLTDELHSYKNNTDGQLDYLKRELHTVLKSFEYQTVQSTINTLYTTQPVPLQSHEEPQSSKEGNIAGYHPSGPLPGNFGPEAVGLRSRMQTEGAFIPVTTSEGDADAVSRPDALHYSVAPSAQFQGQENFMDMQGVLNQDTSEVPWPVSKIFTAGASTRALLAPHVTSAQTDPCKGQIQSQQDKMQEHYLGNEGAFPRTFQSRQNMVHLNHPQQNMTQGLPASVVQPSLAILNQHHQNMVPGHINTNYVQTMASCGANAPFPPISGVQTISSLAPYTAGGEIQQQNLKPATSRHTLLDQNSHEIVSQSAPISSASSDSNQQLKRAIFPGQSKKVPYGEIAPQLSQNYLKVALNGPGQRPPFGSNRSSPTELSQPGPLVQGYMQGCSGAYTQELSQSLLKVALDGPPVSQGPHTSGVNSEVHNVAVNAPQGGREESFLARSFLKEQQDTEQLRQRLEGIARKQKSVAALKTGIGGNTNGKLHVKDFSTGQPLHHPSPHVHFKEPLVVTNGEELKQQPRSGPPQSSPNVSPIPYQVPGVPVAKKSDKHVMQEKRVVVNLPSVWSDVSSTMSL